MGDRVYHINVYDRWADSYNWRGPKYCGAKTSAVEHTDWLTLGEYGKGIRPHGPLPVCERCLDEIDPIDLLANTDL